MNAINRSKTSNPQNNKQEPRRFVRQGSHLPIQQYYSEGVQSIVDHRRLLQVKTDTILLAIDLFRNYLNKGGAIAKATVIPLCIACVLVAAKVNEVFPPRIDDVAEVFDYFASREELIKMQAWILKQCEYNIPFSENLVHLLESKLGDQKQKNIEEAIKTILKCLSDPFFLKIQNQTIAKAFVFLDMKYYEIKKPPNKQIATVIHFIKQKTEKLESSFLKSRDLNVIS